MTVEEKKLLLSKKITEAQIIDLAIKNQIEVAVLKTFSEVEGSGIGFSDYTGRMLIQFEPSWMRKFLGKGEGIKGTWFNNGVGNQTIEYAAFEDACKTNREAALKSCSIGMMQVMGFHYKTLGFKSVQAMWDFANESEVNQLELGIRFIKTNPELYKAIKTKNWHLIAYYYNGARYKELAARLKTTPYDVRFANAYRKFSSSTKIHQTTTTVNIRRGAGVVFDKAADPLRKNTVLTILGEHNGWTHVAVVATGITGWISSQYIS
jgi:hypothetical protein